MNYTLALLVIFTTLVSVALADNDERSTFGFLDEPLKHLMSSFKEGVKFVDQMLDMIPSG
uniref:Uncharacterized protein n=1 Tax=Anopheles albimanus TaxID=7167 RepID=A0A182FWY7_ANOAL